MAQQALLTSGPVLPPTLPSATTGPWGPLASVKIPEIPADLSLGVTIPSSTLASVAAPQLTSAVCTQAIFPAIPLESSSYAFSRTQFSRAALKASFQHDNLIRMARNFIPGQPLPDAPSYKPLTPR